MKLEPSIDEVIAEVLAKLLGQAGSKIVAVSDVSDGLYQEDGLDIDVILKYLSIRGTLLKDYGAEGITHISNEQLLTCDVDVLVPGRQTALTGWSFFMTESY